MAKLFLESTDTSYKVSNSNTTVYGATGDQAVVIDGALTGVTVNSNVERVQFTGSTTDYTYKVVGTNLEVYTAAGSLVTTVGVQTDTTGTQLTFANGTVDAKITGLSAATVGGQAVSATAATAVVIPATAIDSTTASAPAPVFSVSAPVTSVTEAAGAVASYTISLNAAQPAASSVSFALGNVGGATTADYGTAALTAVTGGATLAGSVITFPAGITTATITVPVTVDAITETGEGVSLTLSAPSTGATVSATAGTASVSIIDPPTPVFSLAASATSAAEGTPAVGTTAAVAAGTVTLTVTRAGSTAGTDSVVVQATSGAGTNGAISASDFVALSQTVTFAPTETTKTVTFTTLADSTRESDETLTVSLGTPSTGSSISTAAGASSVTLTITNDDPNLLPVITVPTTTTSAFIGATTPVTGISFTDGDDFTGFTVTVQALGSSQISYTQNLNGLSIAAKNSAGSVVNQNETSNTIVFTGTKTDLNTVLSTINYTTNSTVPTAEQVTITITDAAGGSATKTLPINIGNSGLLTLATTDSLVGSAGDDLFSGTLANFASTDVIVGNAGNDKLSLTTVTGTVAAATVSGVEILDLTLTGSTTVAAVSSTNYGTSLTTVNVNANSTTSLDLTLSKPNAATVVNVNKTIGTLTISDVYATAGTTDAFTVNLTGGITVGSITGAASVIDVLNVNSSGTTANIVTTLGTLTADATVNLAGATALTVTVPNADYAVINGATATGALTVNAAAVATTATTQFAIAGGTAGDTLTGGSVATSITGNAGNDTITGGAGNDTITGGIGADSLTGAAGNDIFSFTLGDSGNATTTRDTISDLAENDIIKLNGYGITGLTNGGTIATSASSATVKEVYINATTNRIVIETAVDGSTTEEIAIPASVGNASFTYSSIQGGVAGDYLVVGAAPLTATNNQLGTLTLTGKSIGDATVNLDNSGLAPTVNGAVTGSNPVNTLIVSNVTAGGVVVTDSTRNDTITGSAQADTFNLTKGGTNSVTNFGYGTDVIAVNTTASTNTLTLYSTTPSWTATAASGTNNVINMAGSTTTLKTATSTTTATVDFSLATVSAGTLVIDASTASGATTLKGAGTGATNIIGGSAVDTITAAVGGGSITGGAGNDVITAGAGTDTVVVNAVVGTSTDSAGTAGTTLAYGTAGDSISGINITTDKIQVVASGITTFDATSTTYVAVGTGTSLLAGSTAASFANFGATAGTGLIDLNNNAGFTDAGDVAINFTGATNTFSLANFKAAVQYSLTSAAAGSTITGSVNNDTFTGGAGVDTYAYTVATATGTSTTAGSDTFIGFSPTDVLAITAGAATVTFAAQSGADVDLTSAAIGTTNYLQADNKVIASATGVAAATNVILEMSSAVGVLSALTTASFRTVFGAGGASAIVTGANDDFGGIVIAYDGTGSTANAAVFYVNTAANADTAATIGALDTVTLIGTFTGIGSNAFVFGNFS